MFKKPCRNDPNHLDNVRRGFILLTVNYTSMIMLFLCLL